jgi:hypothetical protein
MSRGLFSGANDRFRQDSWKDSLELTLWAEEDPQQFQSSSSNSRISNFLKNECNDSLFSRAEVAKEQPGK